jgi:hypothetical protein
MINRMLKNKGAKLSEAARQMILKLRSKHLDLQETERQACLVKRQHAISGRDVHNNPTSFWMLTDGFTAFRGINTYISASKCFL